MSVLNRIDIKLNELNDPQFCGVGFSKSITVKDRNGKWYIYGRIYPNKNDTSVFENIQKSTNKSSTKENYNYLQNHLTQTLWDVSNTKKDYEKRIIDDNKDNQKPYFSDVGETILNRKIKGNEIEIDTHLDYIRKYKRYVYPYFKDFRVDKIKKSDIEDFQIWLREKFNINSVKNIRGVLSLILQSLLGDGIILYNPMKNVKLPKLNKKNIKKETEFKSFNPTEMDTIFEKIDDFILQSQRSYSKFCRIQLKTIILIMYGSGIRSGEILGLQWKDIDFNKNIIDINKSVRDGRIKSTKNEYSERKIQITKECKIGLEILKELRNNNFNKEDFLLLTQYGNMYDCSQSINKLWKTFLDFCKIDKRNIYNLRHTFATTMIQNGLDVVSVSKIMGHRDILTTIQRYVDGSNNVKDIVGLSVRNYSF